MNRRSIARLIGSACLLTAATIAISPVKPAGAANSATFRVTLHGMSGGQWYTQQGCLRMQVPGIASHNLDFALTAGNLYSTIPGAITFATNTGMLGWGSLDTATMTATATSTTISVDAKPISSVANYSGNDFNAGGSIISGNQLVIPSSGDITFTLSSSGVSGFMSLQGVSYLGFLQQYTDWATISGFPATC